MKRLAILISTGGTGSNLQAIIDAIKAKELKAQTSVVVSDSEKAIGLKRAKNHQIPTEIVDKTTDLIKLLKDKYQVDYVCLAGWKLIIPDSFINAFENRILNIHPGLIPDTMNGQTLNPDGTIGLWNRGKFTNKAIQNFIDNKSTYAGWMVHFLSHDFDFGPVQGRCFEKIMPDDTVNSLYDRLKKKEHKLYVQTLIKLCNQNNV